MEKLSDEAREMRSKYLREWRKKNKDRVRRHNLVYWERKAEELKKEANHATV